MKLKPIRNQIVILMGASSGIGRQAALDFVGRGARQAEISMMAADTSMYEELKEAADAAVRTYGRINTWVQLAGANLYATSEQTTPEEWERVMVSAGCSKRFVWS